MKAPLHTFQPWHRIRYDYLCSSLYVLHKTHLVSHVYLFIVW